jgi:acid stress-induced BolA-like protein IbaG/YrbA
MTADELKSIISASLRCEYIDVDGDGRHWTALVVSPEFEGKRSIQRHQRVFSTLGARMKTDEVHALSIHALTPAEWAKAQAD